MALLPVRPKAAVLAGCAALLGSLASPPASADSASYYRLTITDAYIVDIQGTIEHDPCAEVYGHISVWAGEEKGLSIPSNYFQATKDHRVDVCEPNRPLNEGKQVGIVPNNRPAGWSKRINMKPDQQPEQAFQFHVKLTDYDPVGSDDLICDQKSGWIKPHDTRDVWSCKGPETKLNIEYTIHQVNGFRGD
ncbi:hypothetical protein [Streptomyces sp. NBC_01530]|uniref:hypothetical protein n=1 Tax=Streptomyces sp. NBC_01530 TaxID=2903895 RepID=UPI003863219A